MISCGWAPPLAAQDAGGLADGVAGDAQFCREGGLAQRGAGRYPAGQDGLADGSGGLLSGALPLDGHAQAGDRAGHDHHPPSGTSRPAPCTSASRAASAATAASWMPRPVRSATVSSSSPVRPGSRPDASAPSSPYTEPTSRRPTLIA